MISVYDLSFNSSVPFQIEGKLNYLVSARPTAVNIKLATDDLINLANTLSADENVTPNDFKERLVRNVLLKLESQLISHSIKCLISLQYISKL